LSNPCNKSYLLTSVIITVNGMMDKSFPVNTPSLLDIERL
jgi:hypothetical protein